MNTHPTISCLKDISLFLILIANAVGREGQLWRYKNDEQLILCDTEQVNRLNNRKCTSANMKLDIQLFSDLPEGLSM